MANYYECDVTVIYTDTEVEETEAVIGNINMGSEDFNFDDEITLPHKYIHPRDLENLVDTQPECTCTVRISAEFLKNAGIC